MRKLVLATAVAPLALLGGCATKGDIEQLRQEIAGVRAIAQSAEQKAGAAEASSRQAAADAQKAAQDAAIAGEKADRVFRAGLRK